MRISFYDHKGGKCIPCKVDVRSEDDIKNAIEKGVNAFGGIDILINNASAIQLTGTLDTDIKRYDLMNQVCIFKLKLIENLIFCCIRLMLEEHGYVVNYVFHIY